MNYELENKTSNNIIKKWIINFFKGWDTKDLDYKLILNLIQERYTEHLGFDTSFDINGLKIDIGIYNSGGYIGSNRIDQFNIEQFNYIIQKYYIDNETFNYLPI